MDLLLQAADARKCDQQERETQHSFLCKPLPLIRYGPDPYSKEIQTRDC